MIQKIDITKFGIYKDYKWDSNVGKDFYFKSVNIIYGRNYSGKTTLSRIFRTLEKKVLHNDFLDSNFEFLLSDGKKINNQNLSQENLKIFVYNRDFVKDNLSWLHKDDGTIEPFTILGETNNEIKPKIEKIEKKIHGTDKKLGLQFKLTLSEEFTAKSKKNHKDKEDLLNKRLTDKAVKIKNETYLYNVPTYNITQIKRDIENLKTISILSVEEIELKKQLLKEDIKEDIKLLPERKPSFEQYLFSSNELLSKSIKPTQAITDLVNDSLLQEWVKQGIEKHRNKRETCAFCGNVIDLKLWDKIDAHFNKESEDLRVLIKSKITDLHKAKIALDDFIKFSKTNFYSIFHQEYESFQEQWKIEKEKYSLNIEKLIGALETREKDIFNAQKELIINDNSDQILKLFKQINTLITKNNAKTTTLAKDQKQAREELRFSEIAKFVDEIKYIDEIESIKKAKEIYDKSLKKQNKYKYILEKRIEAKRKLELQQQDESKGAEQVNVYLSKIGHSGFKLVAVGEKPNVKFKIIRDEKEAKNLSDGEASLISFCYFIATIKDKIDTSTTIFIDDPISSLDNNHIFFLYSLIDTEIAKSKKYYQLFISTHNLDFLKYLKRLSIIGFKDNVAHYLIERRQKKNEKNSLIIKMPEHLKDYITEFNYLFKEIYFYYKTINGERVQQINNTYNTFYNLPNNIRKFLEYYLFYKYPNTDSPLDNLDKLFSFEVPSLLNRVVNELSHLTHIDRGWTPIDVSEAEECVKIVIDKIKEKDIEQFNALLQSIGEVKNV